MANKQFLPTKTAELHVRTIINLRIGEMISVRNNERHGKIISSYISIPVIVMFFLWLYNDIGMDTSDVFFMLDLCLFAWICDDIKKYDFSRKWLIGLFFLPVYFFKTRKWYALIYFVSMIIILNITIFILSLFNFYNY